jgi:hypothetical protein
MSGRGSFELRPLALALSIALVASPLVVARAALADGTQPAAGSGSGSGSSAGSAISQVNKAFGLLFMIAKLADLCRGVDWPEQSRPPPPRWGWHPDPLPVAAPVVLVATPDGGCELPYHAPVDR